MDNIRFDMRGFIENSLLEWENHVAAVVIAGGCNLRCPYCHSWRYVTGLANLERLPTKIVFDLLDRQRDWIDGVVFTGGEPTLQPGLADMICRVREYDVAIKLHTNGGSPDVVESLLEKGLLDCLALDYKTPLDKQFFDVAGIAPDPEFLERVKRTFSLAAAANIEREYHTTLSPRHIDAATLKRMGEELEPEGRWLLQQYESSDCLDPFRAGMTRFDEKQLESLEAIAQAQHEGVLLKKGTLQA